MNYLTKIKNPKPTSALLKLLLRSQHQNSFIPHNRHVNPESKAIKSLPFDQREFDDVVSSNRLITSYVRAGNLNFALKVFEAMEIKTTVSWNSILAGYAKNPGKIKDARELFDKIPQPDTVSYNTMLTCYLKKGRAETAMEFFESIPVKDTVSWNTMISGFAQEHKMERARELFFATPVKNGVTWSAMISGYTDCGEMASAEKLFDFAPLKTAVSWTAMIAGYMKAGNIESAEKLFHSPAAERNAVTWNAMIAGYVENRAPEEGLKLFVTMVASAAKPNPSTLTSVLNGCSELSALQTGRTVHQMVQKSPIGNDISTGTAIVTMYCKCGDVDEGRRFFLLEMPSKDAVTWNAMITGLAHHGAGFEALNLFHEMRSSGSEPDRVTLWAVLLACSHAGLVETGLGIFSSMMRDHRIEPGVEHYSSVVDLLARAGRLTEAKRLIENIPLEMKNHPAAFGTLLSACGTHEDRQVAEYAAERLLRLDPSSAAAYVQLAKAYGAAGEWDRVSGVRRAMRRNGSAVKAPGVSWIEVKGTVHEFRSDDRDHPEIESIQAMLSELDKKMKSRGYVMDLNSALSQF